MGSRCSRWCRCYWKPCCPPCSWSLHCCPCQHCGQHCSCLQHPPRHRHSCCPSCSWSFLCLPQRVLQRVPQRVLRSEPCVRRREAEAEAEAEAGVVGYHTGVSHGVYPYTAFRAGVTHAVPTVTGVTHAVPSVHAGVYSPVVRRVGVSSVYPNVYSNMYSNVYSGLNHVYGKREAEAEPEANHHFYSNLYHPYTTYTGVRNVVPAVHAGVYNYNYPVHGVYYG